MDRLYSLGCRRELGVNLISVLLLSTQISLETNQKCTKLVLRGTVVGSEWSPEGGTRTALLNSCLLPLIQAATLPKDYEVGC